MVWQADKGFQHKYQHLHG